MNNEFNNNLGNQMSNNNNETQPQFNNSFGGVPEPPKPEPSVMQEQPVPRMNSEFAMPNPEPVQPSADLVQEVAPIPEPVQEPVQASIPEPVQPAPQPIPEPQVANVAPQPFPQMQQPTNNTTESVVVNQPTYQQAPVQQAPAKKSKSIIITIVIISVITIALGAVAIILLNQNSSKKSESEYEDGGKVVEVTPTTTETYSFKGFELYKMSGYDYVEKDDYLVIADDSYATMLTLIKYNYSMIKAAYSELATAFTTQGYTVGNTGIKTIEDTEIIYYELTKDGTSAYAVIIASPSTDYVYEAISFARTNKFDEQCLRITVDAVANSRYLGDYSDYSSSFSVDLSEIE